VEEESGSWVGAEKEGALHVLLFGEADEAVATRETGRRVAHDLGRLGRGEERGEESLFVERVEVSFLDDGGEKAKKRGRK
jgi:hypothetical protein